MGTPRRFNSRVQVTVSEDNESHEEMPDETDATMTEHDVSPGSDTLDEVLNDALLTVSIEGRRSF